MDSAAFFTAEFGIWHCYGCGANYPEAEAEAAQLGCGECGHLWQSPADLERHFAKLGLGWRPAVQILSCPCCAHDL